MEFVGGVACGALIMMVLITFTEGNTLKDKCQSKGGIYISGNCVKRDILLTNNDTQ